MYKRKSRGCLIRKRWLSLVILGVMLVGLVACGVADGNGILPDELSSEVEPEQGVVEQGIDEPVDEVGVGEINEADEEEGEIKHRYQRARQAFNWFHFSGVTIASDMGADDAVEIDGFLFSKVIHDTIGTMADLEAYLQTIFTQDMVFSLMQDSPIPFREIDGVLHSVGLTASANRFAGDEVHEIIRLNDSEIIYRVSVEMFDGSAVEDDSILLEIAVHDFHLILEDGVWLFQNFHRVR